MPIVDNHFVCIPRYSLMFKKPAGNSALLNTHRFKRLLIYCYQRSL